MLSFGKWGGQFGFIITTDNQTWIAEQWFTIILKLPNHPHKEHLHPSTHALAPKSHQPHQGPQTQTRHHPPVLLLRCSPTELKPSASSSHSGAPVPALNQHCSATLGSIPRATQECPGDGEMGREQGWAPALQHRFSIPWISSFPHGTAPAPHVHPPRDTGHVKAQLPEGHQGLLRWCFPRANNVIWGFLM